MLDLCVTKLDYVAIIGWNVKLFQQRSILMIDEYAIVSKQKKTLLNKKIYFEELIHLIDTNTDYITNP